MQGHKGSNRVLRGGSWNNNAQNCRSVNRNNNDPSNRNNNIGFRLVLSITPAHRKSGGHPLNRLCSRSLLCRDKNAARSRPSSSIGSHGCEGSAAFLYIL
ncbi:MAG: SUMF1/EgtB/PvdO family nonheme iron enzyme [Bacteroidetes bacterium]|nr:SUMF1/EgtB/PvdO family nonheme iron enzyme [Bacteroidota bacterium]